MALVFHDYNLALILMFAYLELWLIQRHINCEQSLRRPNKAGLSCLQITVTSAHHTDMVQRVSK